MTNPFFLLALFVLIVSAVLILSKSEATRKFFKYLPVPLWCYFIPTVFSTLGVLPADHPLYSQMSRFLLPACLILLLVGTDLPSIYKLSPRALLAMAAGSVGILVGGVVTFLLLFKSTPELWKGWACLSASWTGGSANMIAVKEILRTPESLFSNLIIMDTITAYSWMAFLVFMSKYQAQMNRKLGIDALSSPDVIAAKLVPECFNRGAGIHAAPTVLESGSRPAGSAGMTKLNYPVRALIIASLLIFAFTSGYLCWFVSRFFPQPGTILNRFTWTVVLATTIPLLLSMTPARKLENMGASASGNFLLYLLLTSIGARANLTALVSAPFFILSGLLWVSIHGIFLFAFGRIAKIPVSLLAAASQANVGGTVSAPIVASVYNKNYAPLGLILAVLGNIYGTTFGLFFGEICRRLANLL